jgi:isopentenyl diphosphate isomerase/L-lactate dehydrogenase-like FMN-dependent dehydrogenase
MADIETVREHAREVLSGVCRVCRICDGRACAGEVPGIGGLGTGRSFTNNVEALARLSLNLRVIHSYTSPSLVTRFLGFELSAPIMVAPVAGTKLNFKSKLSEEDLSRAFVEGARQAGTIAWTGDGPDPKLFGIGLGSISAAAGAGIPVIKPRGAGAIVAAAEEAARRGITAIAVDVDSAALVNMTRAGQPVGPKDEGDWAQIIRRCPVPVVLKGIMTTADASAAVAAGASAIVVSNHGGRALDSLPGTATVLPAIAQAVAHRIPVLVDGGVRSGTDVLKMLALGATAVLVGRPFTVAAFGGGADGVAMAINRMADELRTGLILTGVQDVNRVPGSILYTNPCI